MVFLLRALALACLAVVATASSHSTQHHIVKHHKAKHHAFKFNAHSKLYRIADPAVDVDDDIPACTDKDMKVFTKFAADPKLTKVCGAENAKALKALDFWSVNTCGSSDCWNYMYESLSTRVPLCIYDGTFLAHFLMSRLKICAALGVEDIVPECPQNADKLLAEFAQMVGLKKFCGAEVAKQFTTAELGSINVCAAPECILLLSALSTVMPICTVKENLLQDLLIKSLATCAVECTPEDYTVLELMAEEPLVGTYCGNETITALKTHNLADVDPCASPQCGAIVYFAGQENAIPLCMKDNELMRTPLAESWSQCEEDEDASDDDSGRL